MKLSEKDNLRQRDEAVARARWKCWLICCGHGGRNLITWRFLSFWNKEKKRKVKKRDISAEEESKEINHAAFMLWISPTAGISFRVLILPIFYFSRVMSWRKWRKLWKHDVCFSKSEIFTNRPPHYKEEETVLLASFSKSSIGRFSPKGSSSLEVDAVMMDSVVFTKWYFHIYSSMIYYRRPLGYSVASCWICAKYFGLVEEVIDGFDPFLVQLPSMHAGDGLAT